MVVVVSTGGAVVDVDVVDVVVDDVDDVVLGDREDMRASFDDAPPPHAAPISARLTIRTPRFSTRRWYEDDWRDGGSRHPASAAHTPSS